MIERVRLEPAGECYVLIMGDSHRVGELRRVGSAWRGLCRSAQVDGESRESATAHLLAANGWRYVPEGRHQGWAVSGLQESVLQLVVEGYDTTTDLLDALCRPRGPRTRPWRHCTAIEDVRSACAQLVQAGLLFRTGGCWATNVPTRFLTQLVGHPARQAEKPHSEERG